MMTGMPEADTAVVESPGTFDGIEHVFIRVHFHVEIVKVGRFVFLLTRYA
jgi:hypothetical protein